MIATILGIVGPLLPGIINTVESLFSKKPQSGQDKMSTVLAWLQQALRTLLAQNDPNVKLPTDQEMQAMVETILADMKKNGTLVGTPTTQSPAPAPAPSVASGALTTILVSAELLPVILKAVSK